MQKLIYDSILLASLVLMMTEVGRAESASQPSRPNVVVILADDLGYGDVQANQAESRLPTPHLNRLAEQGMRFTDAHTPSSVCTPTRYGLLTGRYCWRSRLKSGVLNGYGTPLIEADRTTLAKYLQQQGYRTGIVGKWHLGLEFSKDAQGEIQYERPLANGPHTQGFDRSFIIPASLDFPPYVFIQDGQVTAKVTDTQPASSFPAFLRKGPRADDFVFPDALDHLLAQALGQLESWSKQDQPFFLYFPLTAPHKPVMPHSRFQDTTELGPYGDFVAQVDWTVGQVMQKLDELSLAEDTLVIFTSDNGSFMYRLPSSVPDHVQQERVQGFHETRHRSNGPWRGTKADIWEAGHRVPFIARWPGKIEPQSTSSATVCLTDIYATIADVLGQDRPATLAPDSYSFAAALRESPVERPPVIHHSARGMFAIRRGPWKLVAGNGSGGREAPAGKPFQEPYRLFQLTEDPGETEDQWRAQSRIAIELEAELDKIIGADRKRPVKK